MDPDVALNMALRNLAEGDRQTAIEHLLDLAAWLNKGGFMPKVVEDAESFKTNGRGKYHVGYEPKSSE